MTTHENYVLTGRYMNGTEVVGYHLVSNLGNKQKKVTREQFVYLLGKGLVANCTGQLYNEQVIIRGTNGINIGELPIYDERSGEVRQMHNMTNVKPKGEVSNILNQMAITARLMKGRENIGFELKNHGGQIGRFSREKVIELAENKLISNATVQNLTKNGNTKKILRGAGVELRELPKISVE